MKSKRVRVHEEFEKLIEKERLKIMKKTGLPKEKLTDSMVTKVMSNKFRGMPTEIKVNKRRILIS